jgi:hypothetical protein
LLSNFAPLLRANIRAKYQQYRQFILFDLEISLFDAEISLDTGPKT